jgi:cysteine sulfinate desulfinase/cysteine desulfurase-like protein
MCGPTGIGALVGKYELLEKTDPYIVGGGNNSTFDNTGSVIYRLPPAKFEAGTQNIAAILGFKKAVDFIMGIGIEEIHMHDAALIRYCKEKLKGFILTGWGDFNIFREHMLAHWNEMLLNVHLDDFTKEIDKKCLTKTESLFQKVKSVKDNTDKKYSEIIREMFN